MRLFTALAFLSASSTLLVCAASAQDQTVPRYEVAACLVTLPKDEKIDCGFLVVPENRSLRSARTIRLPVMIYRSRSSNPRPDALVYTSGGPGASSLQAYGSGKTIKQLERRDFIVFEQRGTHFAEPSLDCPEVQTQMWRQYVAGTPPAEEKRLELRAAERCHERLVRAGIDLSAYNTHESALDIVDLRHALHLSAWNLYGLSYSTWLMLDVMREDPTGVRSVLLESVLPPDVPYDEMGNANLQRSLNVLFDDCAVDFECSRSYPRLRYSFEALVRRLDARATTIDVKDPQNGSTHTRPFTGRTVVDTVYSALNSVR